MIKLKQLTFANIGRFVGESVIDFESKSNFIQVDAQNLNTGGSSGAGKSTIFQAIEYLFGCNDTPVTILQSRLTKDKISVSAVLEKNGQDFFVSRSKNGLSVRIGAEVFEGNVKLAEEKLNEIMGVKPDYLRKMFHKRQGEGGFFLQMRPQEAYDFLSDILGVQKWTEKQDRSDAAIKSMEISLATLVSNQAMAVAAYDNVNNSLQSLIEPVKDYDDSKLPEWGRKEKDLSEAIADTLAKIQENGSALDQQKQVELDQIKPISNPITADRSVLNRLKSEYQAIADAVSTAEKKDQEDLRRYESEAHIISNHLAQIKRDGQSLPELESRLNELKQAILTTKSNKCPTCAQDWHDGSKNDAFDGYVRSAKDVKAKIEAIKEKATVEPDLLARLSDVKKAAEDLKNKSFDRSELMSAKAKVIAEEDRLTAENAKTMASYVKAQEEQKAVIAEINRRYETVRSQQSKDLMDQLSKLRSDRDAVLTLITSVGSKKKTFEALTAQHQQSKQRLSESVGFAYGKVVDIKSQISETETKLETAKQSTRLLKSFVSQLFQDALNDIALRATAILNRIPNMATASIQFESFKETKTGAIKAEINAVLSADGEIGIPIKSLSGGERTSIDLAVDLAVIDVLESLSGASLDLIVFDEPLNGLDAVSKEEVVQILSQHYSNKKIVIVDHSSEVKEMVDDKIMVVRENQTSKVME